jgi:Tol biopolymer transport system component
VAFESRASNLAPDDANFRSESVFVRDRRSGTTELVPGTLGSGEHTNPSISPTGRYVALVSEGNEGNAQIAVYDRDTGRLESVSRSSAEVLGNNSSFDPSISADGRYVAFHSYASNLVPNDSNGTWDVFVRDRLNGTTTRVSLNSSEAQANGASGFGVISASGRFVAFGSAASNLVPGDTNGANDVFMRDRRNGTTRRLSVSSGGTQANAESRVVRSISPDGRYVLFVSSASNLVPNDTNGDQDVFLRDTRIDTTERVSLGPDGRQANGESFFGSISAKGRFVTFSTLASNMGVTDANEGDDVFVRERAGTNLLLSPRALTFGDRRIHTSSAAQPVTVRNVSTAPVAITGVTLSGKNPRQFSRTHNCGSTLAAGAQCTVNVIFRPTFIGRKSAYLIINGGGAGLRTVELNGAGVQ